MTVTTIYMLLIMPERAPSLKQFVLNLTMLPSFFGVNAVDGVYWTLAKELMFYLGFAGVILIGRVKKNTLWLWIWLGLEIVCLTYTCSPIDLPFQWGITILLIPDYVFAFLAGSAVYYLTRGGNQKEKIMMSGFILVCIFLCFYLRSWDVVLFFALAICALIVCSNGWMNRKTACLQYVFRPFLFLAEISYVLYLTHQFIGFGIIQKMESNGMVGEAWVLLPIIHAILLAAALHYVVEKRINQKLRKVYR